MINPLNELLLPQTATLLEAMRVIDKGAQGVAFVVDESDTVIGTLTDGDIRRAILGGRRVDEPAVLDAMNRDFVKAGPQLSRSEILDHMKALDVRHLPVIDDGRLVGLHLMREIVGTLDRPNWAVLMAGGRGMRLRPITESTPKPMVKVAGRPILERLVLHLVGWGIKRIFISVNHLGSVIEDHFGDGSSLGCHIEYLREETPLGSGGSLSLLPEPPSDPLVVANGDLVTEVDIGQLLDTHEGGNHVATIGVHPYSVRIPFGVIEPDDGRVVDLVEKPTYQHLVNAGVYVLAPSLVQRVPSGEMFPITELIGQALHRNESVGMHLIEEDWADIGRPTDLDRARGRKSP